MVRRSLLLAAAATAPAAAQVQLPSWNDTFCHSPSTKLASGASCTGCCIPDASGYSVRSWTGGDEFPMVKPWYNAMGFNPDSCEGHPMCSACIDRDIDDFRSIMDQKPVASKTTRACVCDATKSWDEGCPSAGAPFVVDCDMWCCGAWKAQYLCQLPLQPSGEIEGPCKEYNGRKLEDKLLCTADGYYADIQVGLHPPTGGGFAPPPPNPGGGQMAWCTEPYYGIQNSTTAVPYAQRISLNCADTVQCESFNKNLCLGAVGRRYCNWVEPIGFYGGAGCLPTAQADRCEAVLSKLCSGMQPAQCLTCAGKQQATLRSVACTHDQIQSHCNKKSTSDFEAAVIQRKVML